VLPTVIVFEPTTACRDRHRGRSSSRAWCPPAHPRRSRASTWWPSGWPRGRARRDAGIAEDRHAHDQPDVLFTAVTAVLAADRRAPCVLTGFSVSVLVPDLTRVKRARAVVDECCCNRQRVVGVGIQRRCRVRCRACAQVAEPDHAGRRRWRASRRCRGPACSVGKHSDTSKRR